MKLMISLLLGLLSVGSAAAQTPASAAMASSPSVTSALDPPDVTVVQFKWQKEIYIPALYEDPLQPAQEHAALEREQKATIKDNAVRAKMGEDPRPLPVRAAKNTGTGHGSQSSSVSYRYEVRIRNTGAKTIRGVVWEYTLLDPETEVQVGYHRFSTTVNLPAGKTLTLVERSSAQPTGIVSANKPGKEVHNKYTERVSINRLEYSDGSAWQRPLN
jgi:hypothetical protein